MFFKTHFDWLTIIFSLRLIKKTKKLIEETHNIIKKL